MAEIKVFIFAGSYKEADLYCKQFSFLNGKYISSLDTLLGHDCGIIITVGTYQGRKDYFQIKDFISDTGRSFVWLAPSYNKF